MQDVSTLELYQAAGQQEKERSRTRDGRLLEQLKQHDRKALERIMARYTGYVGTVIYNILRSQVTREDVEELTADVFIALWEHAPEIRTENLTGYLAGIARNKALGLIRKQHIETEPLEDLIIADDTDISARTEQAEMAEILQETLDELPAQDREILIRYYYYYQTVREIAGEMRMKEATVKTRMHRSRNKLRQIFTERGYGYEQMEFI